MASNIDYFDDLSGAVPGGWTARWVTANVTWVETTSVGSGFVRATTSTADGRHLLTFDEMTGADYEVLTKVRSDVHPTAGLGGGIIFRGSGAAGSENGYRIFQNDVGGTGQLCLSKYVAGVNTLLITNTPNPWAVSVYYWIRARVVGTVIQARMWVDGSTEPGTWQIDTTDSSITAAGWTGLWCFQGATASNVDFECFSYNDSGTAATPQISGIELFNGGSGSIPANWVTQFAATAVTWAENAGGYMEATKQTSSARRGLSWSRATALGDVEGMVKSRATISGNTIIGPNILLRCGGAAAAENGYVLRLQSDGAGALNTYTVVKYVAGTQTVLTTGSFSWTNGTWYRLRLRLIGPNLSAKIWLDGSAEPGSWTYTTTDSSITWGANGLFIFDTAATIDWDWFTFASNGATAPEISQSATATQSLSIGQTATGTTGGTVTRNAAATQSLTIGQTATATTGSVPTIGGLPIGSVGTGIYSGLKLVWGDDFDVKPTMWNFRPSGLSGRYTSMIAVNAQRFYGAPHQEAGFYIDAAYRGPRHESPTDLGVDPLSQSGSVLTITTSVRSATLDNHSPYLNSTGVIDSPDVWLRPRMQSGQLMSWPDFVLSAQGDFIVEFKLQCAAGTLNGYWPAAWQTASRWPDHAEIDTLETWNGASRLQNVTLQQSAVDGGVLSPQKMVIDRAYTTGRMVQVLIRKTGSGASAKLEYFDDFATAGTLVAVGTNITDPTYIDRIRGAHTIILDAGCNTSLPGGGTYTAGQWPVATQFDWIRVWTPVGSDDNSPLTYLSAVNTTPGGSWAASFPSALSMYGFTPDFEECQCAFDNDDNPGCLRRLNYRQEGMTVDLTARTVTGTVPTLDGGRSGLLFTGCKNTGGAAKRVMLYWNVAPAEQPGKVFPNCYPTLGQAFSRTIAFTDFHSGNLGPHTYTVTKISGGTDLTITGNGTGTVTISGTLSTNQTSVLQIDCTNVIGQTTSIQRIITPAAYPFAFDFRNGVYMHGGTSYANFAAVVTAAKATFTQSDTNSYGEDLDNNLTVFNTANVARITNKGLTYEPGFTQEIDSSHQYGSRALTGFTVVSDITNGPSGSLTADRITENTTGAQHSIFPTRTNISITTGDVCYFVVYAKQGSNCRYIQIGGSTGAFGDGNTHPFLYVNVDLERGKVTASAVATNIRVDNDPFLGKGWWKISFFATAIGSVSNASALIIFGVHGDPNAARGIAYTGGDPTNNGTAVYFYLHGSMFVRNTSKALTYVNNSSTSTTVGLARPADAMTVVIPSGCDKIRFVFDDGSEQTVTGLSAGSYAIPTTLNRTVIREMVGLATGAAVNATATQSLTMGQTAAASHSLAARSASAITSLTIGQDATARTLATSTTIQGEVSALHAQAIVEMFEYDDTVIGGTQVVRWHAGTTVMGGSITWQGKVYNPLPVDVTGFSMSASGSIPRPNLKASNIGGSLGGYLRSMDGAVGAKITRRRTLARYMDAVNFPGGNPNADSTQHFPDEIYYLARKTSENPIYIEYELAASFDVAGVQIPRRQVIASTCEWVYRSAECGYAGPPVQTIDGLPTTNPALDKCRKTLDACKARFGQHGVLNSSAFPASLLVQL